MTDTAKELVFTYGTLRPSLYPHVLKRFAAQEKGLGVLESNYTMYNLGAFPALVKGNPSDEDVIRGEVIEVDDLALLDAYEGYNRSGDGLYDRVPQKIAMDNGEVLHAWVYYMHDLPSSAADAVDIVVSGDWAEVAGSRKRR